MIQDERRIDFLSNLYDREEMMRRSGPVLYWYRLVNRFAPRWPRC